MTHAKSSLLAGIQELVDLCGMAKQAGTDDPGNRGGASTHPSAKAEDGTQTASTGAAASEFNKDTTAMVGSQGVNSATTPSPTEDGQQKVQPNTGTTQFAASENASVTRDFGDGKDDSPTTHPANTENPDVGPEKYGSATFAELHSSFDSLANRVLADLANDPQALSKTASQGQSRAAAPAAVNDFQAGYEIAQQLHIEKQAAEQAVQEFVSGMLHDAVLDADLLGTAMTNFRKQAAMAEEQEAEAHTGEADAESGANPLAGGEGGGDGMGPAAGGPMPGGPMPGGPMGDPAGGGADGGLGDALAGMNEQQKMEVLMQLAAALEEQGISLEDLAGLQGGPPDAGGMPPGAMPPGAMPPGAMPPEAGGMPPGAMPPGPSEGMKLASAVYRFKRAGRYQQKAAEAGTRERSLRDGLKQYVAELARGA